MPPFSLHPQNIQYIYCELGWVSSVKYKWCRTLFRATQRTILRCVSRSFKSVSTSSLIILSNVLPLDLKAVECAVSRFFLLKDFPYAPSSKKAISWVLSKLGYNLEVEKTESFHSSEYPPWMPTMRPNCEVIPESSTVSSIISNFIDESKRIFINMSSESIRLFFDSSSSEILHQEISFPKHANRLQAECVALHQALSHVIQSEGKVWEIWSSTKSALNAVFADGKQSALSLENRKSILRAFL